MADFWLGKLLDKIDKLDLWKDTVIVLSTDHGHLLGEHGYWGKNYMFDYKELAHIPLVICAPNSHPRRSSALTSTLDLMPTFMDLHQAQMSDQVHGKSLRHLIEKEDSHHDALLYGYFGKDVNFTDGHYTYCRQPQKNSKVHHHTAMPVNFSGFDSHEDLTNADMGSFLKSANGIPHYRFSVSSKNHYNAPDFNPIYNIDFDPVQIHPLQDEKLEAILAKQMYDLLQAYDAPECQYARLGF